MNNEFKVLVNSMTNNILSARPLNTKLIKLNTALAESNNRNKTNRIRTKLKTLIRLYHETFNNNDLTQVYKNKKLMILKTCIIIYITGVFSSGETQEETNNKIKKYFNDIQGKNEERRSLFPVNHLNRIYNAIFSPRNNNNSTYLHRIVPNACSRS